VVLHLLEQFASMSLGTDAYLAGRTPDLCSRSTGGLPSLNLCLTLFEVEEA
jgi:hypothetical protein